MLSCWNCAHPITSKPSFPRRNLQHGYQEGSQCTVTTSEILCLSIFSFADEENQETPPKGAVGRGKYLKMNQPKPGTTVCSQKCWEELSMCCTTVANRFICQENLLKHQLSVG